MTVSVPPYELVIVENGVLRNLLNDRTITSAGQTANGFSSGPGVVEVTTTHKNSDKELKEKLLAAAKAEGLDYALIIRQSPLLMGVVNIHKISVKDGKEELMRNLCCGSEFHNTATHLCASGNMCTNLDGSGLRNRGLGSGDIVYRAPSNSCRVHRCQALRNSLAQRGRICFQSIDWTEITSVYNFGSLIQFNERPFASTSSASRGSFTINVDPSLTWLFNSIVPFSRSTDLFKIYSPRPEPTRIGGAEKHFKYFDCE